jgi:hypothetical protein
MMMMKILKDINQYVMKHLEVGILMEPDGPVFKVKKEKNLKIIM